MRNLLKLIISTIIYAMGLIILVVRLSQIIVLGEFRLIFVAEIILAAYACYIGVQTHLANPIHSWFKKFDR